MKPNGYSVSKIALVARDYEAKDYWHSLDEILDVAERHACDRVLFSLFSLHRKRNTIDLTAAFKDRKHLNQIILETGDLWNETNLRTEVWCRDLEHPRIICRQFAFSSEPIETKLRLISQFQHRVIDDFAVCVCGEIGILKLDRQTGRINDAFNYQELLSQHNVRIILNPFHTKAFRYEINLKRQELSKQNRWTISVWNEHRSRGRDDRQPWAVFFDGRKRNELVQEVSRPIRGRDDIRVGILNLTSNDRPTL